MTTPPFPTLYMHLHCMHTLTQVVQVQAFKAVKRLAEECSGSPEHVRFENSTFLSEQLTSNRNYA